LSAPDHIKAKAHWKRFAGDVFFLQQSAIIDKKEQPTG
jgi:hypothetical protein